MKSMRETIVFLCFTGVLILLMGSKISCGPGSGVDSDGSEPEGLYSVTFLMKTYVIDGANENEAFFLAYKNQEFLDCLTVSMDDILSPNEANVNWPVDDTGVNLNENIILKNDFSQYSATPLLDSIRSAGAEIPVDYSSIVWTSIKINELFSFISEHLTEIPALSREIQTDAGGYKRERPITVLYGNSTTGVSLYYGKANREIKMSFINPKQITDTIAGNWLPDVHWTGWPMNNTLDTFDKFLRIFVRMHEMGHHIRNASTHHPSNNSDSCAMRQFENVGTHSACSYCTYCWARGRLNIKFSMP
jgi:hypothetical protein